MPFGIIGRTRSGMRQVVVFEDRSTETGTFASGGEFGARHCNLHVLSQRRGPLPNYFGQTCYIYYMFSAAVCLIFQ